MLILKLKYFFIYLNKQKNFCAFDCVEEADSGFWSERWIDTISTDDKVQEMQSVAFYQCVGEIKFLT